MSIIGIHCPLSSQSQYDNNVPRNNLFTLTPTPTRDGVAMRMGESAPRHLHMHSINIIILFNYIICVIL